jgi:uncharacterized damage-inducible protein DinB
MFTTKGLLQFHSWTHNSLDVLFQHCAPIPFKTLTTSVPGFGYKTVRNQLVHILETEYYWIWKLKNPASPGTEYADWRAISFSTVAKLEAKRSEVRQHTIDYLRGMKNASLAREMEISWPDHNVSVVRSAGFYVHHALSHAFHHKGQAVAMLRLLGHPCKSTDLRWLAPAPKEPKSAEI